MSIIKLDQKRSVNTDNYVIRNGIRYYQISESDEMCAKICGELKDTDLRSVIHITSVDLDLDLSDRLKKVKKDFSHQKYRVTTILANINFDTSSIYKRGIFIPDFIERIYFSHDSENPIELNHIPFLQLTKNNPFFEYTFPYMLLSSEKSELFKYIFDDQQYNICDVTLPDGIETIHSFAFVNAEIDTLRIPASVTEIGRKAFFKAKINNLVFEGKWTDGIDPEAFTGMQCKGSIRFNDNAQNIKSYNNLLEAVGNDCRKLTLAVPDICKEDSPAIGYIRATQAYYSEGYMARWNDIRHNEGIIDINTRYIVSVKEYEIPTYTPVTGSKIMLHGSNRDQQHYCYIVYEPVEMVLQKIDTAVKQLNATGCTVDELIDRIQNKVK